MPHHACLYDMYTCTHPIRHIQLQMKCESCLAQGALPASAWQHLVVEDIIYSKELVPGA